VPPAYRKEYFENLPESVRDRLRLKENDTIKEVVKQCDREKKKELSKSSALQRKSSTDHDEMTPS